MNKSSQLQQQGSTLIELMIALAISCFLLLGVVQIYTDNYKNNNFQEAQSANQESSRFALLIFEQQMKKAGYRRRHDELLDYAFPADIYPGCTAFAAGEVITPATAVDSNETGICLRYQPAATGEQDCLGTTIPNVPSSAFSSNKTIVVSRITYLPTKGVLQCQSYDTVKNPTKGEILTGIADLRIEAGIGKSGSTDRTIESYVALGTTALSTPIRALRYTVLFRSENNIVNADENKVRDRWTTIYPDSLTSISGSDKGSIYQIAQGNQALRNLLP